MFDANDPMMIANPAAMLRVYQEQVLRFQLCETIGRGPDQIMFGAPDTMSDMSPPSNVSATAPITRLVKRNGQWSGRQVFTTHAVNLSQVFQFIAFADVDVQAPQATKTIHTDPDHDGCEAYSSESGVVTIFGDHYVVFASDSPEFVIHAIRSMLDSAVHHLRSQNGCVDSGFWGSCKVWSVGVDCTPVLSGG